MFVWLISHQPTLLLSQNKLAISNQPAVLFFSQNKPSPAISHQPNEQAAGPHRYDLFDHVLHLFFSFLKTTSPLCFPLPR
jgi:hypothetical protein